MDHERYPYYFDDAPPASGSFLENLYEALVSAAQRFSRALPAARITRP
jgi:hypothetical protein